METNTLKAGDIVVLKSGSVEMTIEKISLFGKKAWVAFTHSNKHSSVYEGEKLVNESWYFSRRQFATAALNKVS